MDGRQKQGKRGWGLLAKVWLFASIVIAIAMIALLCMLLGVRLVGLTPFAITSEDTSAELSVGDLVYVSHMEPADIVEDDMILYVEGANAAYVGYVAANDTSLEFFEVGGNDVSSKSALVSYSSVVGRVDFVVPYLGYLQSYVSAPPGTYVAIAVVISIVIVFFIAPAILGFRASRRRAREAQEAAIRAAAAVPAVAAPQRQPARRPAIRREAVPSPMMSRRASYPVQQPLSVTASVVMPGASASASSTYDVPQVVLKVEQGMGMRATSHRIELDPRSVYCQNAVAQSADQSLSAGVEDASAKQLGSSVKVGYNVTEPRTSMIDATHANEMTADSSDKVACRAEGVLAEEDELRCVEHDLIQVEAELESMRSGMHQAEASFLRAMAELRQAEAELLRAKADIAQRKEAVLARQDGGDVPSEVFTASEGCASSASSADGPDGHAVESSSQSSDDEDVR